MLVSAEINSSGVTNAIQILKYKNFCGFKELSVSELQKTISTQFIKIINLAKNYNATVIVDERGKEVIKNAKLYPVEYFIQYSQS